MGIRTIRVQNHSSIPKSQQRGFGIFCCSCRAGDKGGVSESPICCVAIVVGLGLSIQPLRPLPKHLAYLDHSDTPSISSLLGPKGGENQGCPSRITTGAQRIPSCVTRLFLFGVVDIPSLYIGFIVCWHTFYNTSGPPSFLILLGSTLCSSSIEFFFGVEILSFVLGGVVLLDFVPEFDCLVFFFLGVDSFFSGGVEIFCCSSGLGSSAMAANESAAAIESAYNAESIARLSTSQESS